MPRITLKETFLFCAQHPLSPSWHLPVGLFLGQNLGCLALCLTCWLLPASVGILHLCCGVLLGLAVFDHTRSWQRPALSVRSRSLSREQQVLEVERARRICKLLWLLLFAVQEYGGTSTAGLLNNQVNYPLQIDQTCCPDPCCSHSVLIAPAIKNSESQRRALHLFRKMLLNSHTQQIPLLQ